MQLAEGERLARLDCQLPEADLAQLVENGFGVIRFAHRHAAGADDHVSGFVRLDKHRAQAVGVIRNNAKVNHLAAQLLQHQVHRQPVGVVNLPLLQRLARQLKLVAGRENGYPHLTHYFNLRNAQ